MIFVYITAANISDSKKISKHLIEHKLVACVNIFPMESMFMWENKVQEQQEFAIIAKTKDENFEKIEKAFKDIHTYEVPCIVSWEIGKAHKPFENWVNKET